MRHKVRHKSKGDDFHLFERETDKTKYQLLLYSLPPTELIWFGSRDRVKKIASNDLSLRVGTWQ